MKKISRILCSIALFFVCIISAGASSDSLCYVIDQQNCKINSYYANQEERYYLFLTSKEKVDELTVYVNDSITSASAGQLDTAAHTLTNAFQVTGDSVILTDNEGQTYSLTVMESLYITLKNVTLDEIHADKDVKYSGNKVNLVDPSGESDDIEAKKVEVKGRGNSSWVLFDKKGYQIKLDKKTSVLGMPKAKKWVLLANASDDSMLRNKIAYDWGTSVSEILAPHAKFVGLWIDGEYRGVYLISEKVEIGSDRVDLDDELGGIFEQDNAFYRDEQYWFQDTLSGNYYTLKDAVNEGNSENTLKNFQTKLEKFENYLFYTPQEEVTLDELNKYIDVDSFAAYYILNEYLLNRESTTTSFYWHCNGPDDVIHLGPIWDFDTCMGNDLEGDSTSAYHVYRHIIFRNLRDCPSFEERVQELFSQYQGKIEALGAECFDWKQILKYDGEMNYIRWDVLGKPNNKGSVAFADTYESAVDNLQEWLTKRYQNFDLQKAMLPLTARRSEDGKTVQLKLHGYAAEKNVWFPVWSDENGQDDIQWYKAEKDQNGDWVYNVELSQHASKGMFTVHAYAGADKAEKLLSNTSFYVDQVVLPQLNATVDSDNQTLRIKMQAGMPSYKNVWFPTWSNENGQDDIQWYQATRDADGSWSCTVDLEKHHSSGNFTIHAYAGNGRPEKLVGYTSVYVDEKVAPAVSIKVADDCATMDIMFRPDKNYSRIWFPTWSAANGQDDIQWYQATYENGVWKYRVDLSDHSNIGTYIVHVYTADDGRMLLLADGSTEVSKCPDMQMRVTTTLRGNQLQITLKNAGEYSNVWFPTWSMDNGQDDIVWYMANKDAKGNWTATVDLTQHHSTGKFLIHVYGSKNSGLMLLTNTEVSYG